MKKKEYKQTLFFIMILLGAMSFSGCGYMQKRGNDTLDIFDFGVTASAKPKISLYAGFLSVLSLGYSNFDGRLYGLGGREFGAMDARQHAAGVLLWGREQFGYEHFDPNDPNSPYPWNVGIIGLIAGTPPPPPQIVNCPKLLHLGWVGLTLNCRFGELADFLLGWTTIDIMGDDDSG